jgi:hypothetical protein
MKKPLKLEFGNLSRLSGSREAGLLGLSLDGGRLEGVVVRRNNGSVEIQHSVSVQLSLDPLTNDPDLVGREIRNHLAAAGIRQRRCVVALPLKWALTTHTEIPEAAEQDAEAFLQIEAERAFPCDVSTLHIATSRFESPSGRKHATIVGIPRNHVTVFEQVLRAAQLKPESFTLGITSMFPPAKEAAEGVLALLIGETHIGLQITFGGGIASLRALEGALISEGGERRFYSDLVTRETRITLGQLPADLREGMSRVLIHGPRDLAQQLADEIELRLEPLGLEAELVTAYEKDEFSVHIPPAAPVSAVFSLAARHAAGERPVFEFLPPKVSAWQGFASRYSAGKLQRVGVAVGAVVFLFAAAFLFQQLQLWRLGAQWTQIQGKVGELKELQRKNVQFRPWSDHNLRGLTIIKRVTEAFPEDGSVTAKLLEIREANTVTCTGTARDYQALLKMLQRLRAMPEIPDVTLGPTRGQSPALQFNFSFAWNEGGKNAK